MISLFLSTSLLTAALSTSGASPPAGEPRRSGARVGELHPPVVLPSLDGKQTLSLAQFAGKKVLLVQFASW